MSQEDHLAKSIIEDVPNIYREAECMSEEEGKENCEFPFIMHLKSIIKEFAESAGDYLHKMDIQYVADTVNLYLSILTPYPIDITNGKKISDSETKFVAKNIVITPYGKKNGICFRMLKPLLEYACNYKLSFVEFSPFRQYDGTYIIEQIVIDMNNEGIEDMNYESEEESENESGSEKEGE